MKPIALVIHGVPLPDGKGFGGGRGNVGRCLVKEQGKGLGEVRGTREGA